MTTTQMFQSLLLANTIREHNIPITEEQARCLLINKSVHVMLPAPEGSMRLASITFDDKGTLEISIKRIEAVSAKPARKPRKARK